MTIQTPGLPEIIGMFDATSLNYQFLPVAEQRALYVTGTPDVRATEQMIKGSAVPLPAVLVDQSPAAAPEFPLPAEWNVTADVQDIEKYAVTIPEAVTRVKGMRASYDAAVRPGQREPCLYVGARQNMTPMVDALIAAGITGGVNFAIAEPGTSYDNIVSIIRETIGTPWPIVWGQWAFGMYDSGAVYVPWLERISAPIGRKLTAVMVEFSDGSPVTYRI